MGTPEFSLSEPEVRRLVRLLAEALSPEDGRAAKCARLMTGLCEWIDADGWMWMRSRVGADGKPQNIDFLYGGSVTQHQLAVYAERGMEFAGEPPENAQLKRLLSAGEPFARSRPSLVSDPVWSRPENRTYISRLGHDAHLYCFVPLRTTRGEQMQSYGLLLRRIGRMQFSPHEATLANAVLSEAGPLHSMDLDEQLVDDLEGLTPRQRTVLCLMVDGLGVPDIADRLSLSRHTVKEHATAIYRHFGVKGQPALLRRFMYRGNGPQLEKA